MHHLNMKLTDLYINMPGKIFTAKTYYN